VSNNAEEHPAPAPAAPAPAPAPIVQPMIDELTGKTILPREDEAAPPRGPVHPPQPAELDQDAGGGYNPGHTFPQT